MKIINLKLGNFQGIKSKEFNFEGKSASIYGDNATGKSTVFNALTWLLFDKASTGAKNFTPKTKSKDGDLHYLDHSSEGSFRTDDGRIVTLKKVFHENYKRKRGSASEEFDGHSIDYYIDGVPVKQNEYDDFLLSVCGDSAEKMKMLTMPDYFSEGMSWESRRRILLEICGDISDEEVIGQTPALKDLKKYLLKDGTADQYYSVDDYKAIAGGKKAEINRELREIPGRIDEANLAMADVEGLDLKIIDTEIVDLRAAVNEIEKQKVIALSEDGAKLTQDKKVIELNNKLETARAKYQSNINDHNAESRVITYDIDNELFNNKRDLSDAEFKLMTAKTALDIVKSDRDGLVAKYQFIKAETWDEGKETCPTCKQSLPAEDVEKIREEFNKKKSQRLEEINAQGQRVASIDMISDLRVDVEKYEMLIEKYNTAIKGNEEQLDVYKTKLVVQPPFEASDEYKNIQAEIIELNSIVSNAVDAMDVTTRKFDEKIKQINDEIQNKTFNNEYKKSQLKIAENQKTRIKTLEESEKSLSREFEDIEKGIFLCELFIKSKVSFLTDKINSKFQSVRFRLFIEQQNGGIREDCEVMIPSEGRLVPYVFSNNAARINSGLEIISTLSKHWGLSLPIFVDNAESVTRLNTMDDIQVIRLVVSEPDKELRLVVE